MNFAEKKSLEQIDAASIKNAPIITAVSGTGPTLCCHITLTKYVGFGASDTTDRNSVTIKARIGEVFLSKESGSLEDKDSKILRLEMSDITVTG